MAVLKCKMCGGDIELSADKTIGVCDSCGTTMTFPKVDDEQRANAFNRGNHFRRSGEFDKALAVYERIVQEDENDAEAHWCCALCRFGIEYVEDPNTFEYLPTCHRASFDSFLEDVDYLAAIEHSDGITRRQYQKDAQKIAEVQRGILATSQNEEPFDVFICYKESENDGTRTRDSLLAQDIYYQLTEQGRRVFFSRITLEDKAGTEYEPYIFAALNSAKVMILVTTSAEHANAVWVKNEWSHFLSLMRKDRSKLLLPCYRDMDPYDLPEALSVLQSYDMSKIGFIQDLTRGVNKVLDASAPKAKETVKETVAVQQQGNASVAPLLERAFMFLEDGNWEKADEFCERVLNLEPKNAEAYLGKAMSVLKIHTRNALNDAPGIDRDASIQKALRFGSNLLRNEINGYIASTKAEEERRAERTRAEEERRAEEAEAVAQMEADKVVSALRTNQAGKQTQSLEQQLAAARQRAFALEKICSGYDNAAAQTIQLNSERTAALNKLNALRSARDSLGLFAGKERKRLDGEISSMTETIKQIDLKLTSTRGQLGGFESKAIADRALSAARADISSLQSRIEEAKQSGSSEFSYTQAIKTLVTTPRVLQIVSEKQPKLIPMYQGFLTVTFGSYPQASKNEAAGIEWLILKTEGSKALLLSKYALDCQQYNTSLANVTWETCSLRKWLNGTFINNAFSSDEQKMIRSTTVTADKNPPYGTSPGNNTNDKVFLLSIMEVNKYFSSDSARQCQGTAYCYAQGAYKAGNDNCWWWLRSPGSNSNYAAYVNDVGSVNYYGNYVVSGINAVRPALWIDLGS